VLDHEMKDILSFQALLQQQEPREIKGFTHG
jgi:hypothetical protein